jgi:hypothetical protein
MKKPPSIEQIMSYFMEFGISDVMNRLKLARSFDEANNIFNGCKLVAKKNYKEMVVKLHPDINKDPEAEVEFKRLTNIWNTIKDLKLNKVPPQSQRVIVRIYTNTWYNTSTNSMSSTGYW